MLSEDAVSTFLLRVSHPELLEAQVDLESSPSRQLAYGIVRSAVRTGRLSADGMKDPGSPSVGDAVIGEFVIEEILFCLHMIDRLAFLDSTLQLRCSFMDALVSSVAEILWRTFAPEVEVGHFAEYFTDIYNARQREYSSYGPPPHGDVSQKNTVLWEYGKRMASLISPAKSVLRVTLIGDLAMEYMSGLIPLVRQAAEVWPADDNQHSC